MTTQKKRATTAVSLGLAGLGSLGFGAYTLQQAVARSEKIPVLEERIIQQNREMSMLVQRFDRFEAKLDSFLFQIAAKTGL